MALLNIIVLNYNNYEETKDCLVSLKPVLRKNISVLVIDGGSTNDSTKRIASEFPEFSYFYNSVNAGFAGNMNFAIDKALKDPECKYVFCINNDAVLEADTLDQFLEMAEKEEYQKYGSFQAKMLWYYDKTVLESAGLIYSKNSLGFSRGGFMAAEDFNAPGEILGCCGGAVIYRREAIEAMIAADGEFFDEDFFGYYEDMDMALRLQWRGWKAWYVPTIVVAHKLSKSFQKAQKTYLSQRNNIYVLLKDLPMRFVFVNLIYIVPVQIVSIFAKFMEHKDDRLVALRAKAHGFKKHAKMRAKRKIIQADKQNWKHIEKFIIHKWSRNKPKYL